MGREAAVLVHDTEYIHGTHAEVGLLHGLHTAAEHDLRLQPVDADRLGGGVYIDGRRIVAGRINDMATMT